MNKDNILSRITQRAHKQAQSKLYEQRDSHKEERETYGRIYSDTSLPETAREYAKKKLSDPRLHRTETVINKEAAKQLERKVENDIKSAIQSGHLAKPDHGKFLKDLKNRYGVGPDGT